MCATFHFITKWITFVICVTSLMMPNLVMAESQVISKCPNEEDYSPCSCDIVAGDFTISCNQKNQSDIRVAFERTSPADVSKFTITPANSERIIQADLLGSHHKITRELWLSCPSMEYALKVDPDAFMSSRKTIRQLWITGCDFTQLDFGFLVGFEQLEYITISISSNIGQAGWADMPSLPKLTTLDFTYSSGLNEWINFPHLVNGLSKILLFNNGIKNEGMDRILQWLVDYSTDTLKELNAPLNNLTRIPKQISSLRTLSSLYLFDQLMDPGIEVIPSDSLSFNVPVNYLNLFSCNVKTIDPGAFKGHFSNASVNVAQNKLTRFEASVFQEMLQQMTEESSTGSLDVQSNPFECGSDLCHLAWLIRDNRNLLEPLNRFPAKMPTCSSGVQFDRLDPDAIGKCPSSINSMAPLRSSMLCRNVLFLFATIVIVYCSRNIFI